MKNHLLIRNFAAFATATAIMPALLFGVFSIFWPNSYYHLLTRMIPFTLATLLFYVMANLLTYCDLKDGVLRCYSYIFNFLAIWFPVTSFAMHSDLLILSDSKALFECKMAIGNMLMALLVAEFCRRYLMKKEKESQTFILDNDD